MSAQWLSVPDLLSEVSEEELAEFDRYVGDGVTQDLRRSERASYSSGDWLSEQHAPAFGRRPGRNA